MKQEPSGNVVGRDLKTPIKRRRSPYNPSAPKKAKKNIQEDDKNNKKGGDITDEESNELDEIAKLKAAITDKNKQIVELRRKSILRQGTIRIKDDLILKTRKLEGTIMDLKAELENLKNNEESLKSTASNLEEKIEALELQLVQKNNSSGDSGEAEVAEKNVVISDLELKLTRKIKKNSDLLKENKRLRKERDSARDDAKKLEVEKGNVADQNEVLESKLKAVKSKNKSLTKDIQDRNDKILKAQTVFEEKLKELSISQLGPGYMSQQEVDSVSVGIEPQEKSDDGGKSELSNDDKSVGSDGSVLAERSVEDDEGGKSGPVGLDDTENQSNKYEIDLDEYIMPSGDEDFEDEYLRIGNVEIKNYYNPVDSVAKGLDPPAEFATDLFRPSVTSLNNKLIFCAKTTSEAFHNGGKKSCGLEPACCISYEPGAKIGHVQVLQGHHNKVGGDVWCCYHHVDASVKGVQLQIQRHRPKSNVGVMDQDNKGEVVVKDNKEEYMVEEKKEEVKDSTDNFAQTPELVEKKRSSKRVEDKANVLTKKVVAKDNAAGVSKDKAAGVSKKKK